MRALGRPRDWALSIALAAAAAGLLWAMGRVPICECGEVKLWHGDTASAENSQHLSDWYSPTHVLHGLLFYLGVRLLLPRARLGRRLVLATLIEAAWEVVENTEAVIERYRAATIALDYYGDSIVNAMADIGFMWIGFLIAARAPVRVSVVLFVLIEAALALAIRDGLLLNVLMLVWPLDAVRAWQAGG